MSTKLNEVAEILVQEIAKQNVSVSEDKVLSDLRNFISSYSEESSEEYEAVDYLEASELLVQAAVSLSEGNNIEAFRLFVQAVNDPSAEVLFSALANWNKEAVDLIVAKALEKADPVEFDDSLEHNWQSDVDDEASGNGDGNDADPETHTPTWLTADDEEPQPGDIGLADPNNLENDPDSNYTKYDGNDDDSSAGEGLDLGPEETEEQTALASDEITQRMRKNKLTLKGIR